MILKQHSTRQQQILQSCYSIHLLTLLCSFASPELDAAKFLQQSKDLLNVGAIIEFSVKLGKHSTSD